ncbi:MAG TPA: hypothetical protein VK031_07260 [Tissierellaceae bacterium]|nr:hypothetical protein [Tissierellaceae bacterium]
MKNSIKNTILVAVMVVLGVFTIGCSKDEIVPEYNFEEPEEEKYLVTAFRLKVYYTKLNLVDTTYRENGGKIVETKVVPKGDISITNFREGKYDLVDSTDFWYYTSVFEFNHNVNGGKWVSKNGTLFRGLYKEGYVHKVVVEMSDIDSYDTNKGYDPKRLDMITKRTFIEAFKETTYNRFKANYIKYLGRGIERGYIFYIPDFRDEVSFGNEYIEEEEYLEFKDVPYYDYFSSVRKKVK